MKCAVKSCVVIAKGEHPFCWPHHRGLPSGLRQRLARWYGAIQNGQIVNRNGAIVVVTVEHSRERYALAIAEAQELIDSMDGAALRGSIARSEGIAGDSNAVDDTGQGRRR